MQKSSSSSSSAASHPGRRRSSLIPPAPKFENRQPPPDWTEYPKLERLNCGPLLAQAAKIKSEMATLQAALADIGPRILAKLDTALGEETKSITYEGVLFTRASGGESQRLDTKWAKRRLLAKGVTEREIDEHTKTTERRPSLRIKLPGDGGMGYEGEDEQ